MKKIIGLGILRSLRKSRARTNLKGFSLIEVLVVALILSIIFGALSMTLSVGDLSYKVGFAKLEAQSELRKDMDWIIRDLRQTDRTRMSGVNSTGGTQLYDDLEVGNFSDPSFYICTGYNGTSTQWSANQVSYVYNSALQQINRTDGSGRSWVFNNITAASFEKIDNFSLRITLMSQITARGTIAPTYTLVEEVSLRNG